jgi:hypothetical protein
VQPICTKLTVWWPCNLRDPPIPLLSNDNIYLVNLMSQWYQVPFFSILWNQWSARYFPQTGWG